MDSDVLNNNMAYGMSQVHNLLKELDMSCYGMNNVEAKRVTQVRALYKKFWHPIAIFLIKKQKLSVSLMEICNCG